MVFKHVGVGPPSSVLPNSSFPPTLTNSPCFRQIHLLFTYFTCIFPPTLTMMHLCITQCTYRTSLISVSSIFIFYRFHSFRRDLRTSVGLTQRATWIVDSANVIVKT